MRVSSLDLRTFYETVAGPASGSMAAVLASHFPCALHSILFHPNVDHAMNLSPSSPHAPPEFSVALMDICDVTDAVTTGCPSVLVQPFC